MTIINGGGSSKNYNGVIRNVYAMGKPQNFEEKRLNEADDIEKITIVSMVADVNISASSSSKVETHLYGDADIDGYVDFNVHIVNRELMITLKFIGNYFNGKLKLDVVLPKKTFKKITAESDLTDIIFGKNVSAEYIKIRTKSGHLETNATFTKVSIIATSGDVKLYTEAKQEIFVKIFTVVGDVSAELKNVKYIDLSTVSMNGNIRSCQEYETGYTANVKVITGSGHITIQ